MYDRLTKDYFAERGYVAEIISGAGFSDVVAWRYTVQCGNWELSE